MTVQARSLTNVRPRGAGRFFGIRTASETGSERSWFSTNETDAHRSLAAQDSAMLSLPLPALSSRIVRTEKSPHHRSAAGPAMASKRILRR